MKPLDMAPPAAPDEDVLPARYRGRRKNTARWCRGKVGVAHVPVIVLGQYGGTKGCGPSNGLPDNARWVCWHIEACQTCGKHLKSTVPCPDNTAHLPQMFL